MASAPPRPPRWRIAPWLALAALVIALGLRLAREVPRLVWDQSKRGAVDLRLRHAEVQAWFAGEPVYDRIFSAAYPPATYLMLWPALGWQEVARARWLWALLTLPLLPLLGWLLARSVPEAGRGWRAALVLLPGAGYAAATCLGNGQLSVLSATALVGALGLLQRHERHPALDLALAGLFVVALIKPALAAPLFWLVLLRSRGWRPALIVVAVYLALTLVAAAFAPVPPWSLLARWLERAREATRYGVAMGGYGNLANALASAGLKAWMRPVSLTALGLAGLWTWRHRALSPWHAAGALALFARLWTYHSVYDDVVVLLAVPALWSSARRADARGLSQRAATALLVLLATAALAPARLLQAEPPWPALFAGGQTALWLATLGYLLVEAAGLQRVKPGCTALASDGTST